VVTNKFFPSKSGLHHTEPVSSATESTNVTILCAFNIEDRARQAIRRKYFLLMVFDLEGSVFLSINLYGVSQIYIVFIKMIIFNFSFACRSPDGYRNEGGSRPCPSLFPSVVA